MCDIMNLTYFRYMFRYDHIYATRLLVIFPPSPANTIAHFILLCLVTIVVTSLNMALATAPQRGSAYFIVT